VPLTTRWLGHYAKIANCHRNRAYCYSRTRHFLPSGSSNHRQHSFAYPQRDDQAELAWMAWLNKTGWKQVESLTAEVRWPDGGQVVGSIRDTILPQSKSTVFHCRVPANLQIVKWTERTRSLQGKPPKRQTDDMAWVPSRGRPDIQAIETGQVVSIVKRKVVTRYCSTVSCIGLTAFLCRRT